MSNALLISPSKNVICLYQFTFLPLFSQFQTCFSSRKHNIKMDLYRIICRNPYRIVSLNTMRSKSMLTWLFTLYSSVSSKYSITFQYLLNTVKTTLQYLVNTALNFSTLILVLAVRCRSLSERPLRFVVASCLVCDMANENVINQTPKEATYN